MRGNERFWLLWVKKVVCLSWPLWLQINVYLLQDVDESSELYVMVMQCTVLQSLLNNQVPFDVVCRSEVAGFICHLQYAHALAVLSH